MPGPNIRTDENVFGEVSAEPTPPGQSEEVKDRKLTVLETHGYILGRTIGSGSYATVKVASSERHNCQVAIKIISKFQAPGDYLKKFLPREIEVVKGLKHENLIRFLQAIETTHRVYIVMEYAENGSLLDIIRRDEHIDEDRGRKWFRQLVEAVDYCHERGVVHRGHMKPKDGVYALSETFCGSYAYASPEILKGVPYKPQESDVWSMGVVLYAIVYGRLPFDDSNFAQLLRQVQNKVSFPREPKVSVECRRLISKILSPLKIRAKIPQILADPWLNPQQAKDGDDEMKQETMTKEETKNIGTITYDRPYEVK
ncbi:testis-specific serine/threonine-protein kinase 3-like isoform X2 [Aricia agestis]|uniref:testis-specific serine/threonine-protein kinase 3-like isoform X2 n=1 Tax=Aricia agestis TaxID=91739 RepID=UPI001C201F6D|nr:testis-specific serine/threonine-protein kinase 3-like isoform X2 [Aricia agestis]